MLYFPVCTYFCVDRLSVFVFVNIYNKVKEMKKWHAKLLLLVTGR